MRLKTILGVFETAETAEAACDELLRNGLGRRGVTLIDRHRITRLQAEGSQAQSLAYTPISRLEPETRLETLEKRLVAAGVPLEKINFCAELVQYGGQLVVLRVEEEETAQARQILRRVAKEQPAK